MLANELLPRHTVLYTVLVPHSLRVDFSKVAGIKLGGLADTLSIRREVSWPLLCALG